MTNSYEKELFIDYETRYYTDLALGGIRGYCQRKGIEISKTLIGKSIYELSTEEKLLLFKLAEETDFKLYRFKKSERILPRIQKVIGILKGICFESLLDVGSGRGAFLFPFMNDFPFVSVNSVDILDERIEMLSDVERGGDFDFEVKKADICNMPFAEKSVDVVTLLEVLEHIPNVGDAIASAVKMAKSYVILTVPSKEDNNPEHIHLLTKEKLTNYFNAAGVEKLNFSGVAGHLIMVGKVD
jgi:SAM-dependent methyltransferase